MILMHNIGMHLYTGVREATEKMGVTGVIGKVGPIDVIGKLRIKTHEEAGWLDGYFNGSDGYESIKNVTRGKVYNVIQIEGFGDGEDITFIDDIGEKQTLGDFFFAEVED